MTNVTGEKKRKLNAFDILLIIAIIGAIAIAVVNIIRANPGVISGGDKEIEYVIKVSAIPSALSDKMLVGDKVYDDESGQMLGEVVEVATMAHEMLGYDQNGVAVYTPIESKIDMYIKIKTLVWEEASALKIDSYRISTGKQVKAYSVNMAFSGVCVSIVELAEAAQ